MHYEPLRKSAWQARKNGHIGCSTGTRWAHNDSKSRAIRVAGRHIGPGPFCRRLGTNLYCVKWRSFSPSQIALWGWKLNTGKPSWRGIQDLSFATKHGYVSLFFQTSRLCFLSLFVPIPLIRKGVFFCLHSFSSVSVKMSLFYFHSINSGSKVDRMFLVFWERSVCPEGSLKFDCVILQVLPNSPTALRWPGSLPTASFLARDYE